MKALGKVFKYGDNVDTDVIIPARYLNSSDPDELATHCMEDIDKGFVKNVQKGDIIVALENGESALKHCHGYANGRLSFSDGASGMIRECSLKEFPLRGIVVGVQRSL